MKNHETFLYLDEPEYKSRFFDWRRWVDRLPALSRATLPVAPRFNIEADERVQAYLNALRDNGPFATEAPP